MRKSILAIAAMVAVVMAGCKEDAYINEPGDNGFNYDTIPVVVDPEPTPDPEGVVIPEGAISVNEAVNICKRMQSGAVTEDRYFIKGWVKKYDESEHDKSDFETNFTKYGNEYIHLCARQDGSGTKDFYAYRILGKFGAKLPDHETLKPGDFVVICCYMTNYKGRVYESSGLCHLYSSSNEHFNEVFPWQFPGCPEPGEGEISVTGAEKVSAKLASKATSTETYKIRGIVSSIDVVDTSYGNATFNITDGAGVATCYRIKGPNNGKFTDVEQLHVGDTVLVNANIQNYNGTCEPVQGYVEESTNPDF